MRTPRSGILIVGTIVLASVLAGALPAAADGGAQAATGLAPETFLWAGLGAGVLVLGGLLLFASRRRARRDAQDSEADAGPGEPQA